MENIKKFKLWLSVLSVMTATLIIALVAVLSAIKPNDNHNLKIAYSAENVCAEVSAGYLITKVNTSNPASLCYSSIKSKGKDKIEFNARDTNETLLKSFDGLDVEISYNEFVYFKYTFKHTGNSANSERFLILDLTKDFSTFTNFKIEYMLCDNENLLGEWQEELKMISLSYDNNPTVDVFIRLSVETKTKNAEFFGSFNWSLSGAEYSF